MARHLQIRAFVDVFHAADLAMKSHYSSRSHHALHNAAPHGDWITTAGPPAATPPPQPPHSPPATAAAEPLIHSEDKLAIDFLLNPEDEAKKRSSKKRLRSFANSSDEEAGVHETRDVSPSKAAKVMISPTSVAG